MSWIHPCHYRLEDQACSTGWSCVDQLSDRHCQFLVWMRRSSCRCNQHLYSVRIHLDDHVYLSLLNRRIHLQLCQWSDGHSQYCRVQKVLDWHLRYHSSPAGRNHRLEKLGHCGLSPKLVYCRIMSTFELTITIGIDSRIKLVCQV